MCRLSGLKAPMSFHKKQISIVSKIETTVEDDDRGDLEWRTKLEPVVSTTIRRGSETMVEDLPPASDSGFDSSVGPLVYLREALLIFLDVAEMEDRTCIRLFCPPRWYFLDT